MRALNYFMAKFLFFFLPLFLEVVSGPSASSAFCSASNMANCRMIN